MKQFVIYYLSILLLLLVLGLYVWVPLLAYFGKIGVVLMYFRQYPLFSSLVGGCSLALAGYIVVWVISKTIHH